MNSSLLLLYIKKIIESKIESIGVYDDVFEQMYTRNVSEKLNVKETYKIHLRQDRLHLLNT